jgi:hypothetical protein
MPRMRVVSTVSIRSRGPLGGVCAVGGLPFGVTAPASVSSMCDMVGLASMIARWWRILPRSLRLRRRVVPPVVTATAHERTAGIAEALSRSIQQEENRPEQGSQALRKFRGHLFWKNLPSPVGGDRSGFRIAVANCNVFAGERAVNQEIPHFHRCASLPKHC